MYTNETLIQNLTKPLQEGRTLSAHHHASLAFIIGCVPLTWATGAGAGARNAIETTVVGGMLMATCLGIFRIPVLFVFIEQVTAKIQTYRRRLKNSDPSRDRISMK